VHIYPITSLEEPHYLDSYSVARITVSTKGQYGRYLRLLGLRRAISL
jgi:hypothetical protein